MGEIIAAERDEKRPPGWAARSRKAYTRAVRGRQGAARLAAAAQWAMDAAGTDPGMAPEAAREQVIRASQAMAKVLDPVKTLQDQTQLLAAAERRIDELEARLRAIPIASRDRGVAPAPALQ